MYIISFIVGGLASSAMALEYADLAPCGQVCIKSMFEQAYNMNCPPYADGRPNLECLCKDANFFNGIHDCVFGTCNTQDADTTVDLATIYCTDPKYKSPDCPCLDPLMQPSSDASPAAAIAPAPEVDANSNSDSDSSANNDDVSNPSDLTNPNSNTNSDDSATPNGGSNDNTLVATPTINSDGVASSNSVETEGEGGGLKTVTAFVAPKITTELANTASTASAGSASKTNELDHADASTPTSASSGAAEKKGTGAREMGKLRERVLLVVVLGFVMVL